jgi:NAD(P)-dependent dehydrogenase (short-subunit alcohol dehydrogenase family)
MSKALKKLCIVVGVGPGLGLAIAKRFGKNEFKIAMVARSKSRLLKYQKDLAKYGIDSAPYPCDVGNLKALASSFDNICSEHGNAEVLAYNVSILNPGTPSEISVDAFVDDFKVNVAGALVAFQRMTPQMKGNKEAAIILTGGGLATDPYFEFASLGAGKAALRNLAMSMAQEGAKLGIRVATITIKGMIKKGTYFDPEKISLEIWKIYKNKPKRKDAEVVYAK